MKSRALIFIVLSLLLTYTYLYPGSQAWLDKRTDIVMSDGTDVMGGPYIYDQIQQIWLNHPSRIFYGAIWSENWDPVRGWVMWQPWLERPLVPLVMAFNNSVQASTGMSIVLILISIAAMYALGSFLRWPPWISFALAIAWGLCAYTRARAQVHTGFTSVSFIPLVFLGLLILARGRGWRSVALSALAMFLAAMAPHYYIVTMAFLSPFLILFYGLQPESRSNIARALKRLLIAALPAVLFLGLSLKFPIPSYAKVDGASAFPTTGDAPPGELHPFMRIYAARAVDFFTSDLGLAEGPTDINPLKSMLNKSVYETLVSTQMNGNPHERTNGIRWLIWVLGIMGFVSAIRFRKRPESASILVLSGLAFFAFLTSLSPDVLGFGPSAWLYKLVSQIRVPSRAGIWVHFCLLMIAGYYLSAMPEKSRFKKWAALPLVLLAAIVIEYPPMWSTMRIAQVAPEYKTLQRENGICGTGMYFPFANGTYAMLPYYQFIQRSRGADCKQINSSGDQQEIMKLTQLFPPAPEYLAALSRDMLTGSRLKALASCVPLSFIAFDAAVPASIAGDYCRDLGWNMSEPGLCVSPQKGAPFKTRPIDCAL